MASRSNQPRITGGSKISKDDYHYAHEVAGQPATTPEEKKTKQWAKNLVDAYESRFPKAAAQERTTGGVKPNSPTVNKVYRPEKYFSL
jgi:ABC-type metal ion transport system substrate-binding protein